MATEDELGGYLREHVRTAVLGGYKDEEQALASIEELAKDELGDGAAVEELLAYARRLFEEHRAQEARWTEPTMNDALDRAFEELNHRGILALQNAGYTMSEGWEDVAEVAASLQARGRGATFFHGQDVERGVRGQGLMLAFGAFEDDPKRHDEASVAIGREVCETLARHGIKTEWNGSVETRIHILPFPWRKRRGSSRPTQDPLPLQERVLRRVMQEQGLSREAAISALEEFLCEAARKHYGEGRRLEAHYNPELGRVELFQSLQVVEQLARDPATAANQRTLEQLRQLGAEVETGDELVLQIFYHPEDAAEARAQDANHGELLALTTAGRGMKPWTEQELRDGLLGHLRVAFEQGGKPGFV